MQSLWVRLVSSLTVFPDQRVCLKQWNPSKVKWMVSEESHFADGGRIIWIRSHDRQNQRQSQPRSDKVSFIIEEGFISQPQVQSPNRKSKIAVTVTQMQRAEWN
jgi:hypothetical protein